MPLSSLLGQQHLFPEAIETDAQVLKLVRRRVNVGELRATTVASDLPCHAGMYTSL